MSRDRVRIAVLSSIGALAATSPAQADPVTIPEATGSAPSSPSWESKVRSRLEQAVPGWMPSLRSSDSEERNRAEALLARHNEIGRLVGSPIAASQQWAMASRGEPLQQEYRETSLPGAPRFQTDLRTEQGRLDSVLICLALGRPPELCDLNTVMSPEEVLQQNGGTRRERSDPLLNAFFTYYNLAQSCPPESTQTSCYGSGSVDARTGMCFMANDPICASVGRPFAEGRTADWTGCAPTDDARTWVAIALHEHASVAAFALHVQELLAIGAPLELVQAATQAQADEVRHPQLALDVAQALGAEVHLGPLDTAVPPRSTRLDILLAVAREGCVHETLSAVEASVALQSATLPRARAALETIVTDESEHSSLAWRTLKWGLSTLSRDDADHILRAMEAELARALDAAPEALTLLEPEALRDTRAWGIERVIRPALAHLRYEVLGSTEAEAADAAARIVGALRPH